VVVDAASDLAAMWPVGSRIEGAGKQNGIEALLMLLGLPRQRLDVAFGHVLAESARNALGGLFHHRRFENRARKGIA
jgi:hypothetical protein